MRNLCHLTIKGKEFANRFDTVTNTYEKQAKISTCTIATKTEAGQHLYLIHERLKQPYFGYFGFITGKLRWGETVTQGAIRELTEETGLVGTMKLKGIEHKMDFNEKGELLDDKFFYIYKASSGKNHWLTLNQIKEQKHKFDDMLQLLMIIEGKSFGFIENMFTVQGF